MKQINDLTGKKFGRLTVLKKIGKVNKFGGIYWDCICECGNITWARTAYLNNGRKASCGCIRSEKSKESIQKLIGWSELPKGEAAFNTFYHQYKTNAKNKPMDFDLSKKDFFEITQKNCFYCDCSPNTPHQPRHITGPYVSNGIDRVDSSIGYTLGNIVPCCRICNIMKQQLSIENFIDHIGLLWNNRERIGTKK